MSRNIFLDKNQFVPKPKRNAYDKSKLVNGTYKAGYIYPIDWEEVTFGDSVKLDLSLALRTMPMVWPIQTPVIAKVYSFYVRYRTLHKNYSDMRFNNKPANFPFIALPNTADFWKTGELGDHLGIPTTYASSNVTRNFFLIVPHLSGNIQPRNYAPCFRTNSPITPGTTLLSTAFTYDGTGATSIGRIFNNRLIRENLSNEIVLDKSIFNDPNDFVSNSFVISLYANVDGNLMIIAYQSFNSLNVGTDGHYHIDLNSGNVTGASYAGGVVTNGGLFGYLKSISSGAYAGSVTDIDNREYGLVIHSSISSANLLNSDTFNFGSDVNFLRITQGEGIMELNDVNNPFSGSNPSIPLCAYLPRAYEMCYRYYFQDLINEPFVLDGEAQYNRFITNDGDGADTTDYKLFRRNWEADFLTSAKPSPQQGMAPLVGLTSDGTVTLVNSQGNEYSVQVTTDSGDVINGFNLATQKGESDYSVRRTLLELATTGFTINSLRNTNAFQQWLEANYRRGLKLKDQVLSNFGVSLELKELDCPEFIGGFSVPLNVDQIAQTSSSVEGSPLGDLAGNGALFGKQKHSITHYCDEEGVVITMMCIVPIPVYSQLLNRSWLKSTPVDFYNPSFGKIGQQPITYEEVCPVQAFNEGVDVHSVFGYQRPWYHLISSVDEVHGMMRNNMSGFLMQRIFGSTPELGASFLHVDEEQINDVFVARNSEYVDNYYGQIGVKKYKKTCIPRYALPALS